MEELKKILTALNNSIHSQVLSDALAASELSEVEWKEEDLTDIEDQIKALMTVDAAVRNKEVIGVIKDDEDFKSKMRVELTPLITKNVLDNAERKFQQKFETKFGIKFPEPHLDENGKVKNGYIFQMMDFLESAEIKGQPDGEMTKKLQDKEDRIEELVKNSKKQEEEFDVKLKTIESDQVQKEIDRTAFNKLSTSYNWAQKNNVKDLIITDTLNKAAAKVDLKIEGDEILLFDKGKDTRLMEGNNYVTFTEFFEPQIRDHLKTKEDPPPTPPIVDAGDVSEKEKRNVAYRQKQEEMFSRK